MSKMISRRAALVGLTFVASGFGIGCGANPFLIPAILGSGGESKLPPEFALKLHDKKKEAKVVILVSKVPGINADLHGIDRMLNAEVIKNLDEMIQANEEKVLVLKMKPLDDFKADNPNWESLHPKEIGKKLEADYVIDIEINELDLYKAGTRDFLQGHTTISISAFDVTKPLRDPSYKTEYTLEFPRGQEIPIESRSQVSSFRLKFVQRVAFDIAMKFTYTNSSQSRHRMD